MFLTALHKDILTVLRHAFCFCAQLGNYTKDQMEKIKKSSLYIEEVDPGNWVGLEKTKDLLGYLRVTSESADIFKLFISHEQKKILGWNDD